MNSPTLTPLPFTETAPKHAAASDLAPSSVFPEDLKFEEFDIPSQTAMVMGDMIAAYDLHEQGELGQYAGEYIAVLNRHVVGAGQDLTSLLASVSCRLGIHPNRLAVIHVEAI